MNPFRIFIRKLIGPVSRFKKTDAVQFVCGGPIMVITKFSFDPAKPGFILVHCSWFDSNEKITKTQAIPEEELKLFNWYDYS